MFSPIIVVSREEVVATGTASVFEALRALVASPETAIHYFETVDTAFHGYNDWPEELFEIQEVRDSCTNSINSSHTGCSS